MFGLRKRKAPEAPAAKKLYAAILSHIRTPAFYTACGVPDTFDGRFDLLLLHLFLVLNRTLEAPLHNAEPLNQALFDATFSDMDQTLREMGIGDMGVPKHMRRMMKAFNGRMQGYAMGLKTGTLPEVLKKNLYGTCADIPPQALAAMTAYILDASRALSTQRFSDIQNGFVSFPDNI